MKLTNNQQAFLALLRAGLWETDARLTLYGDIDYDEVYRASEVQSVIGLVTAGVEHVVDAKIPKEYVLLFVGTALQLEQRNNSMNAFIADLIDRMRNADIYSLVVKGQGVAQCYERPLWRACGDVDLLCSESDYEAAKGFLLPLATHAEEENIYNLHLAMTIDHWEVELHGNMRGDLWKRIDNGLDGVQKTIFCEGKVRTWVNEETQVFLPNYDEDVVYVFAHILQHFFQGGIGLRQICDWCRLLWMYKDKLDTKLLETRINSMGLMSEWRVFASLAVKWLGMPIEAMPLYSNENKWLKKSDRVLALVFETGNFGYNRDFSFYHKYPFVIRKIVALYLNTKDCFRFFLVFPWDSLKVWKSMVSHGLSVAFKGK